MTIHAQRKLGHLVLSISRSNVGAPDILHDNSLRWIEIFVPQIYRVRIFAKAIRFFFSFLEDARNHDCVESHCVVYRSEDTRYRYCFIHGLTSRSRCGPVAGEMTRISAVRYTNTRYCYISHTYRRTFFESPSAFGRDTNSTEPTTVARDTNALEPREIRDGEKKVFGKLHTAQKMT